MKRKLISLKEKTYQRLVELGKKNDSFDTIVSRLLEEISGE